SMASLASNTAILVQSCPFFVGMVTQSLVDGWIWGLAFAYSDTDVESDGVNNTNTDIDSYQVSLYTSYDLDDRIFKHRERAADFSAGVKKCGDILAALIVDRAAAFVGTPMAQFDKDFGTLVYIGEQLGAKTEIVEIFAVELKPAL
ncbi:MAG: hypothetical protein CFH39_02422, partial [Alphaproteobacteria bacterium MarineAlpha10_Bin2]